MRYLLEEMILEDLTFLCKFTYIITCKFFYYYRCYLYFIPKKDLLFLHRLYFHRFLQYYHNFRHYCQAFHQEALESLVLYRLLFQHLYHKFLTIILYEYMIIFNRLKLIFWDFIFVFISFL